MGTLNLQGTFAMKGILNYIRISVCKCGVNNSMFDIDGIFLIA